MFNGEEKSKGFAQRYLESKDEILCEKEYLTIEMFAGPDDPEKLKKIEAKRKENRLEVLKQLAESTETLDGSPPTRRQLLSASSLYMFYKSLFTAQGAENELKIYIAQFTELNNQFELYYAKDEQKLKSAPADNKHSVTLPQRQNVQRINTSLTMLPKPQPTETTSLLTGRDTNKNCNSYFRWPW